LELFGRQKIPCRKQKKQQYLNGSVNQLRKKLFVSLTTYLPHKVYRLLQESEQGSTYTHAYVDHFQVAQQCVLQLDSEYVKCFGVRELLHLLYTVGIILP